MMKGTLISRRQVIQTAGIGFAAGTGLLTACKRLVPKTCTPPTSEHPGVGWGPSVFRPVFYGFADYVLGNGDHVRMYYPSVSRTATCSQVLGGTAARYPLVLFLHGHCPGENNHYLQWDHLGPILARSGFVVAVPNHAPIGHPNEPQSTTYARAASAIAFARNEWPFRHLLFSTVTAVMGHSFGALHAQQIAANTNPTAFVGLSGQQAEFGTPPQPTCPKMFVFGTGEDPVFRLSEAQFNAFPGEKHQLTLAGLHHWDYAPFSVNSCIAQESLRFSSPCGQYHRIAADMIAIFLSRYMSSEHSGILDDFIPANLVLPPVVRTPEQQAFASGWLSSLAENHEDCSAALKWSVPFPGGVSQGERTIPA